MSRARLSVTTANPLVMISRKRSTSMPARKSGLA
jgi:hypothetical protein